MQVNVGAQPQAVSGSIQPLSAQALTGTLSTQVSGATLQLPGQVTVQHITSGEPRPAQHLTATAARSRKMGSLSLFFRKVLFSLLSLYFGSSSVMLKYFLTSNINKRIFSFQADMFCLFRCIPEGLVSGAEISHCQSS